MSQWDYKSSQVLYATALCLGFEPTYEGAREMIDDPEFISKLCNVDMSNKHRVFHTKLDRYVHKPDFSPAVVSRESILACILCEWVLELHHSDVHRHMQKASTLDNPEDAKDNLKRCKHYNDQFDKFMNKKGKNATKHRKAKSSANVNVSFTVQTSPRHFAKREASADK